jgi:hypothetical protein
MHNDSSRHSDEAGHDAPGTGLRVRPPAHPVAAQAAGPDAAREKGVLTKPSGGRGPAGLTERLAAASARRARLVLAIWGIAVVVALILAGTSLRGLTTSVQRLKLSGMHWTVAGADAITALRCQQASRPQDRIWNAPHNQTPAA